MSNPGPTRPLDMKRLPILLSIAALAALVVLPRMMGNRTASFETSAALEAAADGPVAEGALTCVEEIRLERGEAPSTALMKAGLDPGEIHDVLAALGTLVDIRAIRPSDCLRVFRHRDGEVSRFDFQRDPTELVVVEPVGEGFEAREERLPVERRLCRITGSVEGNLWDSLIRAGGSPNLVVDYSDLFAWSFDFLTDTRNGDGFDVLVEEDWIDGERVGFGRVRAGRYHPAGDDAPMEAYWFQPPDGGDGGYYTADGESVRRQFLKSPLNFRRISSHFSHSRMHPIFKQRRPHLGVDYAAASGTPVVALGNGKVTFRGWINGFGNTIKIKHNNSYLTQYAHLRGFAKGIRNGSRVQQGDVIGYVGQTGNATGPHLDFRVQENGRWVDPLRIKGGKAEPLPGKFRELFARRVQATRGTFDALEPGGWMALDGGPDGDPLASAQLDTPRGS